MSTNLGAIQFEAKEQRNINIQQTNMYIQPEALVNIISKNLELDKIVDFEKVGWDKASETVYGSLPDYLRSKYVTFGGLNLIQYKLYNFGDSIVEISFEHDPSLKFFSLTDSGADVVEARDGKNTLRAIPQEPIVLIGSVRSSKPPRVTFSTGDVAYRVESVSDFRFTVDLFGINPADNPGFTFLTYVCTLVVVLLLFVISIMIILRRRNPRFVAATTSDEEYVKLITSLRHLRRRRPKRLRQIIRLCRLREDEVSGE